MRGVGYDPVRMCCTVALGEFQVAAPHGVTQVSAAVTVYQPAVQSSVASLASWRAAVSKAADGGHGDVGDHDGPLGGPGLEVLADVAAGGGLPGRPLDVDALLGPAALADGGSDG